MDSYTITIAPNDDSGAATRLVVDTSGEQVRITDVHLHAPHGLSSGHIPTVDFALLLQAVTGTGTASGQTVAGTAALTAPQDNPPALEAAPPAAPQPAPRRRAKKTAPPAVAAPAPRRARPRAETATPAKSTTKAKTAKAAATPAKKQKAPAPAKRARVAATTTASGRVYRRTPDDLAEVFEQVETVAGVAEHYEVPRYTAQGWVNRLRATS